MAKTVRTVAGFTDNAAVARELVDSLNYVFGKDTANMLDGTEYVVEHSNAKEICSFVWAWLCGAIKVECLAQEK